MFQMESLSVTSILGLETGARPPRLLQELTCLLGYKSTSRANHQSDSIVKVVTTCIDKGQVMLHVRVTIVSMPAETLQI